MAAYNQRCAVHNWLFPTGNAPPPPEEEIPQPFPRPSVPTSSRTEEEKQAFARDFKAKQNAYTQKKKEEKEEKYAEALASATGRLDLAASPAKIKGRGKKNGCHCPRCC